MLAYMQSSPPPALPSNHSSVTTAPSTSNRMSLAVLPSSPITYGQPMLPTMTSPSKKPKLSINTTNLTPLIRKGATSLRLETLSATSPTIRNTFQNAYSPSQAAGTTSQPPTLAPLNINPSLAERPGSSGLSTPQSAFSMDHGSSATSMSSTSTLDSLANDDVPYKLSYSVRSILRNTPLPRTQKRKLSQAPTWPMFPVAKKVAFRLPLTEEVITTKYTLRHSDIESSSSLSSALTEPVESEKDGNNVAASTEEADEEENTNVGTRHIVIDKQRCQPRMVINDDDITSISCPATPVAGRANGALQWRWTLSDSEGENCPEQSSPHPQSLPEMVEVPS